MATDDPHFRLRLPAKLKDRIAVSAKDNGRTINGEVVFALTQAYPDPKGMTNRMMQAAMRKLLENDDDLKTPEIAGLKRWLSKNEKRLRDDPNWGDEWITESTDHLERDEK